MRTLNGDYETMFLMRDYINELFEMREEYMLPMITDSVMLKPVCTGANKIAKLPEYLKYYYLLRSESLFCVCLCFL